MSRSAIVIDPIDVQSIVDEVSAPSRGAIATFLGTVRDSSDGRTVSALDYSAYDAMARREMDSILSEAVALASGVDIVAVHRIGDLRVGDVCVMIAASHAHRAPAFEACRFVIEQIKMRVPIWKREHYADGSAEWVNACATGTHATSDAV